MADTTGKRLQGAEHRVSGDATQPSSELGNTDIEGLEGRDIGRDSRGERPARETSPEYVPLYPPGPGDRDGWAYLLSIVPEAEPTFCRTLNGITSGVDLRLRAIGNGVVPAVAARAFRVLSEKLKKQGNFPEL